MITAPTNSTPTYEPYLLDIANRYAVMCPKQETKTFLIFDWGVYYITTTLKQSDKEIMTVAQRLFETTINNSRGSYTIQTTQNITIIGRSASSHMSIQAELNEELESGMFESHLKVVEMLALYAMQYNEAWEEFAYIECNHECDHKNSDTFSYFDYRSRPGNDYFKIQKSQPQNSLQSLIQMQMKA